VASYLYPSAKVIAVKEVRAYKRIRVGAEGAPIRIKARRLDAASHTVEVRIDRDGDRNAIRPNASNFEDSETLMLCQVVFASEQISDGGSAKKTEVYGRRANLPPAALYGPGTMFHGPRMQSVISLETVADREICGRVSARLPSDWFEQGQHEEKSAFLLNPLLLDNATQLVLFHLYEHEESATALLPFLVESVNFYADLNEVSGVVNVKATLHTLTQRDTNADVQIFDDNGCLLVEFRSIRSRRILLNKIWSDYVANPKSCFLSKVAEPILNQHFAKTAMSYRLVEDTILPNDEGTLAWCADYVLSPSETYIFESLPNPRRRREWLIGRIAAKEAVRHLANRLFGVSLTSGDIEIYCDEFGKPFSLSLSVLGQRFSPSLSIAHKNGTAVAMACESDTVQSVGIDLETIEAKEEGFEQLVLSASELARFKEQLDRNREVFLATIWSVKEAIGKAFGHGVSRSSRGVEIVAISPNLDECTARALIPVPAGRSPNPNALGAHNQLRDSTIIHASTHRKENFVLSVAFVL